MNAIAQIPVQYDGEFVLTKNGSKDFGEISPALAKEIRRQAGKIRLRIGVERKGEKGNYGERHIGREERLAQINTFGFANVRDFVEYVCTDFDRLYTSGRSLIVYKESTKDAVAYVTLEPADDGDFYDVKTATPARKDFLKNKTPLWQKSKTASSR